MLFSHDNGFIEFPYDDYPRFDLESKDAAECKSNFRVEKNDLPLLAEALGIPPQFTCHQGTVCNGMEGLCILLKRCAYPCRYSDMIPIFGRSVPELCMISNEVTNWMFENHGHRLTEWNNTILNAAALHTYADAVASKGAALTNCFGFVDGTLRQISRPGQHQRIVYNGQKRAHGLKFQSIIVPNGMIANLYGPVGKRIKFY